MRKSCWSGDVSYFTRGVLVTTLHSTGHSVISDHLKWNKFFPFTAGSLTLNRDEELEINTTAPSVVKKGCHLCLYTASLQNRSSSHGDHLVAVIELSNGIEFRSGSIVRVFGKYALSITSQNGNIVIQTDINMTCGERVQDTTCLGGFTQSSAPVAVGPSAMSSDNVYTGKNIFRCLHVLWLSMPLQW